MVRCIPDDFVAATNWLARRDRLWGHLGWRRVTVLFTIVGEGTDTTFAVRALILVNSFLRTEYLLLHRWLMIELLIREILHMLVLRLGTLSPVGCAIPLASPREVIAWIQFIFRHNQARLYLDFTCTSKSICKCRLGKDHLNLGLNLLLLFKLLQLWWHPLLLHQFLLFFPVDAFLLLLWCFTLINNLWLVVLGCLLLRSFLLNYIALIQNLLS